MREFKRNAALRYAKYSNLSMPAVTS